MKHTSALLLAISLGALLTGCGSEAVYTEESFASDSPFKLKVTEPVAVACESARRSLLGQGYLIDTTSGEQVKGRKAYRRDDSVNTFIEMNVVCVADRKGSTLYANGVLSTYDLKKSGNSASVGISAVGSISLPIGQSADSLVKIAEETIEDKAFYGRFFAAVGHVLKEMEERPEEDESATGKDAPAAAAPLPAKPAPEADIPLEPGPASSPGIVPEPGPAPAVPAMANPQPVNVPEPGAPAPVHTTTPPSPGPAAPGPVQGFSVSAPASLPHAEPAPQPLSPALTPALPPSSDPAPGTAPAPAAQPAAAPPAAPAPAPSTAPATTPSTGAPAPAAAPDTTPAPNQEATPAPPS